MNAVEDRSGEPALPELVVLCGLQASGKSTFARAEFVGTHAYVSKDLMRNVRRKEKRQATVVSEHLAAGRSVVVDNTNPTVEERARLIALARRHGSLVRGFWFPTPVPEAIARNALREGKAAVPLVAIFATAKRFEPPTLEEGYDSLHVVLIRAGGGFDVRSWDHVHP